MKPDLSQFEKEYGAKLNIVKVDVRAPNSDNYKKYRKLMDSKYVPYLIVINGEEKVLNKHTGGMTKQELVDFVKPHLK